ncbi:transmembrane protein, putative [Medicago truncatula]|uniref:Transmembrane protein, putative n=1 Tax=Medicago truncatula TaxID=3880 RepID=A0A072UDI1_MEDTR|nr:transmembrane protein, putative [Medicago truncatula]
MFRQTLGSNLGIGKLKWDFGVKNGFFPSCSLTARPVSFVVVVVTAVVVNVVKLQVIAKVTKV